MTDVRRWPASDWEREASYWRARLSGKPVMDPFYLSVREALRFAERSARVARAREERDRERAWREAKIAAGENAQRVIDKLESSGPWKGQDAEDIRFVVDAVKRSARGIRWATLVLGV